MMATTTPTTPAPPRFGGEPMRLQLVDPQRYLLAEIADPTLRQTDVAQTLALVRQYGQDAEIDWAALSAAGIARWGRVGWRRIKTLAWSGKCWPRDAAADEAVARGRAPA